MYTSWNLLHIASFLIAGLCMIYLNWNPVQILSSPMKQVSMVRMRSNRGRCIMYMSCNLSIHCILMRGASNMTHNAVFHMCVQPNLIQFMRLIWCF